MNINPKAFPNLLIVLDLCAGSYMLVKMMRDAVSTGLVRPF